MDIKSIKTVKPNRKLFKKIIAILFSIGIIIVSIYIITESTKEAQDTVEVMRIKSNKGMIAKNILLEDNLEVYRIIRKEFDESMIEPSEVNLIVNKYSNYYLRGKSIVYEDQFSNEKPKINEWLYNLDDGNEVLTLPYNYLECGGDILMPGDFVRIRVSYEGEQASSSSYSGNPNGGMSSSNETEMRVEVLFESIIIKDMLNYNSHSIYEVYKEVLKLDEEDRQKAMKSEKFLKNIQPKALLLEGSSEQIEKYAKYINLDNNSFLITILNRNADSVIIDQLPTLEREIETWIEESGK